MRTPKLLGLILGVLMALAMTVPAAHADPGNQMTKIIIDTPFQVLGHKTLAPGTYWFRIWDDAPGARNVVEIYNGDRSQLLATALTRPTYRTEATNQTELEFATAPQKPATLVRWFYPGKLAGHTFVYSPLTEQQLREETVKNVMVTPSPTAG